MDKQQAAVCMGRRPALARRGERAVVQGLAFALIFSVGLLTGIGLSYGTWIGPGRQEAPGTQLLAEAPAEPTAAPTMPMTEPPTQPATEPPTQPATEATEPATEPETEPATEPPTEPQPEEPAVDTAPPATDPPASDGEFAVTGYILPNSSTEYLTWEDYAALSRWELVLARNEIFARHGRRFQNQDIQAYFDSCSWYEGTIAPEDFDTSVMNDVEVQNVWTLKAAEG